MRSVTTLTAIQEQFAHALIHPAHADAAMPMFNAHPFGEDRLALYRGNLTAIWNNALVNAYPVLHQLVGSAYFEQVARAYGRAHPSISGDLNDFGADLPVFLKNIPDAADYPYFPDMAALEWRVHRAYYATDDNSLSLAELVQQATAGGHDVQTARLELHSAVSLYRSDWASVDIWLAHQPDASIDIPANIQRPCYGLICRPSWSVQVVSLDQPAWLALNALQQDATLADALEVAVDAAVNSGIDFDINHHLQSWFSAGLFRQVKFSEPDV